jgi:hypothetical protein
MIWVSAELNRMCSGDRYIIQVSFGDECNEGQLLMSRTSCKQTFHCSLETVGRKYHCRNVAAQTLTF